MNNDIGSMFIFFVLIGFFTCCFYEIDINLTKNKCKKTLTERIQILEEKIK